MTEVIFQLCAGDKDWYFLKCKMPIDPQEGMIIGSLVSNRIVNDWIIERVHVDFGTMDVYVYLKLSHENVAYIEKDLQELAEGIEANYHETPDEAKEAYRKERSKSRYL